MIIITVESLANVHTHLREGSVMEPLVQMAKQGGADVLGPMPNTIAGLKTADEVLAYVSQLRVFTSRLAIHLMPIVLLTEETTEQQIDDCVQAGIVDGKIYPRDRTTKSHNGVIRYGDMIPLIWHCGRVGMKVHLHPEHPSKLYFNRDAEFAFLPIVQIYLEETEAIIVWEHGTDARCIPHWKKMAATGRFFVTLTAHHLATNEDDTFGDVRATCKPPIKTESDRHQLVELVEGNYPWVMAGGDDAFHPQESKQPESGQCACGAYTAPFLLPLYAHALEDLFMVDDGLTTFVNFTSRNARRLHKLPDGGVVNLGYNPWKIPTSYPIGIERVLPFWAGRMINWRIL